MTRSTSLRQLSLPGLSVIIACAALLPAQAVLTNEDLEQSHPMDPQEAAGTVDPDLLRQALDNAEAGSRGITTAQRAKKESLSIPEPAMGLLGGLVALLVLRRIRQYGT